MFRLGLELFATVDTRRTTVIPVHMVIAKVKAASDFPTVWLLTAADI